MSMSTQHAAHGNGTSAEEAEDRPERRALEVQHGHEDDPAAQRAQSSQAGRPTSMDPQSQPPTPQQVANFLFCFAGLQGSYLTWGYVQEKIMTRTYHTGKFPSSTFCVFSNRIFAVVVAAVIVMWKHRSVRTPAPLNAFLPCSLSNSLSSYASYQSLRYVSFPLQTLTKSCKVIPVMLMGKILHKKNYPLRDYIEAACLSVGVYIFSCAEGNGKDKGIETQAMGVLMLAMYITTDSFTSQWQSRLFKDHSSMDQFQMMMATNLWSMFLTLLTLTATGELGTSIEFLLDNPDAVVDNVTIALTSATGQLFIFYTIRSFGPIAFTVIMTTRQLFSMVLSAVAFGHPLGAAAYLGTAIVFVTIIFGIKRKWESSSKNKASSAAGG